MYKLSVGAIFKNEEGAMVEWIEHYLYHGVEHFYLINDGSTDSSMEKLQPYIDRELVTLFDISWPQYLGRQCNIYSTYILPHLKETEWLLMVDMDEFVYSPKDVSLVEVLKFSHYGQIQIRQVIFVPSGDTQPKSIVASFTERIADMPTYDNWKYFVNSKYEFNALTIHNAAFKDASYFNIDHCININPDWFVCNHYMYQSREFWNKKCGRGDADCFKVRLPEEFDVKHETKQDTALYEQNKVMLERIGLI